MSRGVNQVQHEVFAIMTVIHLDGVAFDCDAALALKVHIVEHLVLQVFAHHCFCMFKQSVGKRTLAVVNVRYNAKIPYMIHLSSITVRRYAFLVKY